MIYGRIAFFSTLTNVCRSADHSPWAVSNAANRG